MLTLRAEIAQPVTVVASRSAIGHVLDVLVDNALRHGEGDVTVSAFARTGGLELRVTDAGRLGEGDPEALFSGRPIGLDQGVGAPRRGIGLGLARRLTEAEGGDLRCTSTDPTTFSVVLSAI